MEKIISKDQLNEAIRLLEIKQNIEGDLLKEQFCITFNSFKPLNIIKNSIKEAVSGSELKNNLLGTAVGLATGLVSKSLVIGATHNPLKKIVGTLIQLGVTSLVSKNPETIKLVASGISKLFRKKNVIEVEIKNEHSL